MTFIHIEKEKGNYANEKGKAHFHLLPYSHASFCI